MTVMNFQKFTPHQQLNLLDLQWPVLAGPGMLPVLRRLYRHPAETTLQYADLQDFALRRLYELDPKEGRQLILDQIQNRNPTVLIETLGILPDDTLSQYDNTFVANLESWLDRSMLSAELKTICLLIERYASPSVFSKIKAVYENNEDRFEYPARQAVIAYLMRCEPGYGVDLMKRELDKREKENTFDYTSIFSGMANFHYCPELEALALERINGSDTQLAEDIFRMLKTHGSVAVEEPLWKCYEIFHEEWKDRPEELSFRAVGRSNDAMISYEHTLYETLTNGRAWIIGTGKMKRLQQLCVQENTRRSNEWILQEISRKPEIHIHPHTGKTTFSVQRYYGLSLNALKDKLLQYPIGTAFLWHPYDKNIRKWKELSDNAFRELKAFLETNVGSLEIQPIQ